MSFLAELDCYLTVRRQLGADLSTDERILRRFATFADRDDVEYVNTNLVMRWLESLPSASPGTRATRFRVARQFAEWLHGMDPKHEAPPRGLVPGRVQRVHPYIIVNPKSLRSSSTFGRPLMAKNTHLSADPPATAVRI